MGSVAVMQLLGAGLVRSAEVDTSAAYFNQSIRPLLSEFCLKCHSTEKQKGELDLERFASMTELKKHPKVWQGVIEQLSSREMPPKEKPQPTSDQRDHASCDENPQCHEPRKIVGWRGRLWRASSGKERHL